LRSLFCKRALHSISHTRTRTHNHNHNHNHNHSRNHNHNHSLQCACFPPKAQFSQFSKNYKLNGRGNGAGETRAFKFLILMSCTCWQTLSTPVPARSSILSCRGLRTLCTHKPRTRRFPSHFDGGFWKLRDSPLDFSEICRLPSRQIFRWGNPNAQVTMGCIRGVIVLCSSVLQCDVVCCSVLQCLAVSCSVL